MNEIDPEEYNNIIQELNAAEEEGENALSLFLHDLIEIDIESNFTFSYVVIERVLNICEKSLNNHLILLSNECIFFIRYCINKCENIKEEVNEAFFKTLNNIISVCLNERKYPDDMFLLFERSFFMFVQDINNVINFIDVWNGHNEHLNEFTKSLLGIIAFHLCLLNETIYHLKNSTSTNKHKRKITDEENDAVINKNDCNSTCQEISVEGNTSIGVSSMKTENTTLSEALEKNVSFIQKGYSRIKIIEIASDLLLYFFENSGEIKDIEEFEDSVNIILKEYEIIPDIEIKKKILSLFKSISIYVLEKGLTELAFYININALIKRKKNYYLTLTKEKNLNICYLKENSYVYINNSVLSIQTVSYLENEDSSEYDVQTETTILTPNGFKGSLLINIFYVYFYNTKNELLMVLSYDRIQFKHDEENIKRITLHFTKNDVNGVLSNKLKQKFEEYFQDVIEISISFNSAETKRKIYDVLTNIVRIENSKSRVEDIIDEEGNEEEGNEEENEENEEENEGDMGTTEAPLDTPVHDIECVGKNKDFSKKEEQEKKEKEKENKNDVVNEAETKIIKEKLQRRKVSFATTKEIRLLNDNESVASKTIPLEESINIYSCSVNAYSYDNGSSINETSTSAKVYNHENEQNDENKSIISSVLDNKIIHNRYYRHKIKNLVNNSYYKYEDKCNHEHKNNNDQCSILENTNAQVKETYNATYDVADCIFDNALSTTENGTTIAHILCERKCFSEKDGDDYKKINEQNEARKAKIDITDKYKYKETHPNKLFSKDTTEKNEKWQNLLTEKQNLQLYSVPPQKNENTTKPGEEDEKKYETIDKKENYNTPKNESDKKRTNSSISATEIVNELLGLNHKQENINKCIETLKKKDKKNEEEKGRQKIDNLDNNGIKESMISNENDGRRRSKRVQAKKNGYGFEVLQIIEGHQNMEKEKEANNDKIRLEKKYIEANNEAKTKTIQNVSEIISIVGIDEPSNEPIIRNSKENGENEKEKDDNKNGNLNEKKEEVNGTAASSIDKRSIVSSNNKKRVFTNSTADNEDYYSKNKIDSPYPLKKIKQSYYDASLLDSLKKDDNLEKLSIKYLMKAYTLIQYNRRHVHIQIVDYFRHIKKEIIMTHQELNMKYNNLLIDLQNEYEKKFENIIQKYSTRLISKKRKLNTNAPQVLDLRMIQHKINVLGETLNIIQNTVKHKIQNSNILLKYKESELYTPTFSLATILSKHSH